MDLSSLLKLEKKKSQDNQFSWKKYTQLLQVALQGRVNNDIVMWVDEFVIITDLIDDLMDGDRPLIHSSLLENREELFQYLFYKLKFLRELISSAAYQQFIRLITESLYYQLLDCDYKITLESKESDYFRLVLRSVYLMQAIVYLVDEKPPIKLLQAIKYIATSAQIENDLQELKKKVPYDVLDNKGTLPLIKTIEWANESKNTKLTNLLLSINRKNYTVLDLEKLLNQIEESPSVIYCRLLQLSFEKKAKIILEECNLSFFFTELFNTDMRST